MPSSPHDVSITVLIRTFNSAKILPLLLDALDFRDIDECIIVDSGSSDSTLNLAAHHGAKVLKTEAPFNYSRALNTGFEAATCDWVLVISSHCVPTRRDLLARMRQIAGEVDDAIAVIYGKVSLYDPGPVDPHVETGTLEDWNNRSFRSGGNAFAMYPKKIWKLRDFNEDIPTAEDLEWLIWALNSGYSAAFAYDAIVMYRNQGSLAHMFRKGRNEALLAMRFGSDLLYQKRPLHAIQSLAINTLYLMKLFVTGRITGSLLFRMLSHALGVVSANMTPGSHDASTQPESHR